MFLPPIQIFMWQQVLVTHHVELALPGAYYLVRMLDGQIDVQGTVKDLRAQGVLEAIQQDTAVDAHQEEIRAAEESTVEGEMDTSTTKAATDETTLTKKARKLVKEEHRETGGVKWSIYKSYLKASYAIFFYEISSVSDS
jgi:ABC-type sulfate/molybdate transport systems ATPase subunit